MVERRFLAFLIAASAAVRPAGRRSMASSSRRASMYGGSQADRAARQIGRTLPAGLLRAIRPSRLARAACSAAIRVSRSVAEQMADRDHAGHQRGRGPHVAAPRP